MQISDVVKNSVFCIEEMSLTEVFELMGKNNCKCIPVVESDAHKVPIGSITEHDICLQLIGKNRDPRWLTAANVMNANISKVRDTANVNACLDMMRQRNVEQLFVIDERGMLCGTVTREDLESVNTEQKIKILSRQLSGQNSYANSPDRIF